MFETASGSALSTWRSSEWPVTATATITPIAEHRRDYLGYEGPVSGNRGTVRRVADGFHRVLRNDPAALEVDLDSGINLTLERVPKTP